MDSSNLNRSPSSPNVDGVQKEARAVRRLVDRRHVVVQQQPWRSPTRSAPVSDAGGPAFKSRSRDCSDLKPHRDVREGAFSLASP